MKKLFMFLAVAGLATFGASCSSSDDNGGDNKEKQLTISSDAKDDTVIEGASVKFTAKVEGKEEAGATFYVDGTKVSNPHKFDKKGTYKVVAKKDKFKDSAALTITVTEEGTPPVEKRTLVLKATPSEVVKGASVTFTVKDDQGATITDAVIKKEDGTVVSSTWVSDAVGTIKFTATKADYNDSNVESVIVKEEDTTVEGSFVTIDGTTHNLGFGIVAETKYKGSDARVKFNLTDGREVYEYTFQLFEGSSEEDYTEDLFGANGVVQMVTVFIEATNSEATIENTPVAEWIWGGVDLWAKGVFYTNIDNTSTISFGFGIVEGNRMFATSSTGAYQVPASTAYELDFEDRISNNDYVSRIDPPAGNAIRSLKSPGKKPAKFVRVR